MNEITISGNVTADPVLRYGRDSDTTAFLAFTVAVNRTATVIADFGAFRSSTRRSNAVRALSASARVLLVSRRRTSSFVSGSTPA